MQYYCVEWLHDCPSDPVIIYSETDANGWEMRKMEVFADGTATYATEAEQTGDSFLAEVQMPSLAEIAADPEFLPRLITKREFEAIWAMTRQNKNGKGSAIKHRPSAARKPSRTASASRRTTKRL